MQKVLPFKIPKPKNDALVYQQDRGKQFYNQLHQHAEIQISYIEKGAGSLIVGDSINEYRDQDILVIGGFVPHVFKTDNRMVGESKMHTLFFGRYSFGPDFFDLPDLALTKDFFKKSEFGMRILSHKQPLIDLFQSLSKQNKLEQISTLLTTLSYIVKSESEPLSSFVYRKSFTDDEGKRIGNVFRYAMENFHEPISLKAAADVANMSKNAFCRYFKKHTNKTFFQFLIEIRIENACKLLTHKDDLPIALISEQCGFHNTANFNRKFKQLKGCTPSQFRFKFQ